MHGESVYWHRATSINHLHLGLSFICLPLSCSNRERNFAVPLMPCLASKYRSVSLNCVKDSFKIFRQGSLSYFAQKLVLGCAVVGFVRVERVGVGDDGLCIVLDTTVELLRDVPLCGKLLSEGVMVIFDGVGIIWDGVMLVAMVVLFMSKKREKMIC